MIGSLQSKNNEREHDNMRLIAEVNYTDDCTYNYNVIVPVMYESKETFITDFQKLANKTAKKAKLNQAFFELGGQSWDAHYFVRHDGCKTPTLFTIDEWFSNTENKLVQYE
jgi:glutathionyl-hydroquinone reductase